MSKERSLMNYIVEHCNESMERALAAERFPLWERASPELSDSQPH